MNLKFQNHTPTLTFHRASAHRIPFHTNSIDLVLAWSVLHWIGRDQYLQALGELIRVTKKYLVVMDFVADKDYRVPYHHMPGLFTYKLDFEDVILRSEIMRKIKSKRFITDNQPSNTSLKEIKEGQLLPFIGNNLSYKSRKMVIFSKDYEMLPIYEFKDFVK